MKLRLSPEAITRIKDNIEAEEAVGDSQFASDLQVLLNFYLTFTKKFDEDSTKEPWATYCRNLDT